MRTRLAAVAFWTASACAQPTVDEIMAKVAENQARALEARSSFLYHQRILARFHRTNGKLAREERREYEVLPSAKGTGKKLARCEGRYETKGKFVSFTEPGHTYKGMDLDGEIMDDFIDDMTGDDSRDGIGTDLFPLTAEEQRKYRFTLKNRETYRGAEAWRVAFAPRPGEQDVAWKGEALIDAREFQPIMVTTRFATRIPLAVKVLLGIDIQGLGFSVTYRKFDEGVWFPVSYGGEFKLKALFLYKRNMSISMVNDGFRRAEVTSRIAYVTEQP